VAVSLEEHRGGAGGDHADLSGPAEKIGQHVPGWAQPGDAQVDAAAGAVGDEGLTVDEQGRVVNVAGEHAGEVFAEGDHEQPRYRGVGDGVEYEGAAGAQRPGALGDQPGAGGGEPGQRGQPPAGGPPESGQLLIQVGAIPGSGPAAAAVLPCWSHRTPLIRHAVGTILSRGGRARHGASPRRVTRGVAVRRISARPAGPGSPRNSPRSAGRQTEVVSVRFTGPAGRVLGSAAEPGFTPARPQPGGVACGRRSARGSRRPGSGLAGGCARSAPREPRSSEG
jgi:hypothetical protein